LERLLKSNRVLLYEIGGFDGLMASFYEAFRLEIPQFAENPLMVISSQLTICSEITEYYEHTLLKLHTEELRSRLQAMLEDQ
jgi:hypothetical protein